MKLLLLTTLLTPILTACTSNPIAKKTIDKEIERLCKMDGGIKIYETVGNKGQTTFSQP